MKRILFLCFFNCAFFNMHSTYSQPGEWVWMLGDSTSSNPVFGTKGVPSPTTNPPGIYEPAMWQDLQGNVWIFAGNSYNPNMWKLDMQLMQWTWIEGNGPLTRQASYGIKGVASSANWPHTIQLFSQATWVDHSGNFWMMEFENAVLWMYDISINQWTW